MSKIFGFLFVPLGWLIRMFYSLTHNYLISILLFALVIEIILSPLQIKQQKNQIKQAKLAPKTDAIRKRYNGRNDNVSKQKMNQEIMDVYQQEGFNPAGGCLPLLIQLPIVLCVYQVIINPLTYLSGLGRDVVNTIKASDLFQKMSEIQIVNTLRGQTTVDAVKDGVSNVVDISKGTFPDFHLFKLDLAVAPKDNLWPLILIPILVFLTTWGSSWIMRKFTYQTPEAEEAQSRLSMKIMNLTLPLFSAWISYMWVAVLGIYWAFRSLLSVGERFIISKAYPIPHPTEEEIKAAEKEAAARAKKEKEEKKPVRSLHRIDEDDEELPPPVFDDDDDDDYYDRPREKRETGADETSAARSALDAAPMKDGPSRKDSKKEKKNKKKEK